MATRRILIFYIVENSGHHAAARYLQSALRKQEPETEVRCVDLLKHTHPKWEKIVQRTYMTTIRRTPELWDALYDNFWIEHLTRRLRHLVQQGRSESLRLLIAHFRPDAILCTQAYAFAVMTSFVARMVPGLPVFAVTTDFVPHRFWVTENATHAEYMVPTDSAAARLMWLGINQCRIRVVGIPVLGKQGAVRPTLPEPSLARRVLVIGGSRGVGVRFQTVRRLDLSAAPFTIDLVCGMNQRLRRRVARHRHLFKHPIRVRGYVRDAAALMCRACLIVTKAGGVTLAEACCTGIPILIVHPLPGQERGNTEVMVHQGAALHVRNEYDLTRSVTSLLNNPALLGMMRDKAVEIARPDAAEVIARHVLDALACGEPR